MDQPQILQEYCNIWTQKIQLSREHKRDKFGKHAAQAMKYYLGPHDFVYEQRKDQDGLSVNSTDQEPIHAPAFKMTLNKVAEMVQIFGPMVYHTNPTRTVKPRHVWKPPKVLQTGPPPSPDVPPDMGVFSSYMQKLQQTAQETQPEDVQDAQIQAKASLLEAYLNYTPNELGLKEDNRLAVDEALVTGGSCSWTEIYVEPSTNPGQPGRKVVGSFFGSVKELFIDPDVNLLRDAKWIMRECIEPVWKVERDRPWLKRGSLKGSMDSADTKGAVQTKDEANNAALKGQTADLCRYYKIWSKMGLGVRLKDAELENEVLGPAAEIAEQFGDYVYLEVAQNVPFPINLPPDAVEAAFGQQDPGAIEELKGRLQWPIPFWADNTWPMSFLQLHPQFDCPWPIAHIRPALGEQIFLDWGYSHLAGHILTSCRQFICILKSAGEEIKLQIINGRNLSVIELDATNKSITELVSFLAHPPINRDLFEILQLVERNYEKRTGQTEMLYASPGTQSRSAQDASAKSSAMQIRPDDMAERVEQFATEQARKEGIAARLMLRGEDVAPILGDYAAQVWDSLVHTDDVSVACREFDYRVEASSARKPNKEGDMAKMQDAAQFVFPVLMQEAQARMQSGQPGPYFTAVNAFLKDWAAAHDFEIDGYFIAEPDPAVQQFQQMQQQQQAPQPAPQQGPPAPQQGPPQQAPQGPPQPGPQAPMPQGPQMQVTPQ